jgi:predicted acylesterase/phospholipase RssA
MRDTAKEAFARLHIPPQNRALLTLDGGGIRGILTIQLLKALEEQAGAPCHRIFDLVAGTSTGGIIAGLIASGKTAFEIEALYEKLVSKVFLRRDFFANQFVNPPAVEGQLSAPAQGAAGGRCRCRPSATDRHRPLAHRARRRRGERRSSLPA